MKLKEIKNGWDNNGSFIPNDEGNNDYQAIKKYIADGGEYEKFDWLADAKTQKINEIGQAKEEALYAPIAYLNTSFSASERACQNMLGNLVLNGETVEWQELNKKPIIMTRAQFQTLAVMVKNQRNASYFKEGELMKKIALAKTPEELKQIKW